MERIFWFLQEYLPSSQDEFTWGILFIFFPDKTVGKMAHEILNGIFLFFGMRHNVPAFRVLTNV